MRIVIVLSVLLIHFLCLAQDTTKVLFIGNSFTSQNNLPSLFAQISQGSGKKVVVASHMPGGVSVGDISQGTSAHMNNPNVYSLIRSNDWDYLVLQDNQGRFCLGYGQFPSSSLVIEGHIKIRDSLLFYHPCAHMIWYAGFGTKNGLLPYAGSGSAMIDSIYQNYQYLRDTAGQIIAPIGPAFKRIISQYPSINLWDTDDTHPSLYGSYLIAGVLYTTFFKSSPIISSFNPGITPAIDSVLKNTAYQTTVDSMNTTGLDGITPEIHQVANTLSVNGYQNCRWYYNGTPYLSGSCTININSPGNYFAMVSDSNYCDYQTMELFFQTTGVEGDEPSLANLKIFPNPASDFISIQTNNQAIISSDIGIYDIAGQLVHFDIMKPEQRRIDISSLENGLYVLVVRSKETMKSFKLIIQR